VVSGTYNNDFSLGNDCRVVLILGSLGRLDFSHVIGFTANQLVKKLRVPVLNYPPLGRDIPGGWEGSFDVERANSAADDMSVTLEAMFWNGQRLPTGQLYQYLNEVDGSVSTYLFEGVTVSLRNAGTFHQEQPVKQTVEFFARRRVRQ
jgi:hypothetical protein